MKIMWQIWIIISGICFVAEMITVGFFIFWFGIGALLTALISLITDNIIIQTTIFLISSTLLTIFTKPLVKKFVKSDTVKTNSYSLIGKTGLVTKEINSHLSSGQVKINSEVWSAKSETSEIISEGSEVEIKSITGVKVVVAPISK